MSNAIILKWLTNHTCLFYFQTSTLDIRHHKNFISSRFFSEDFTYWLIFLLNIFLFVSHVFACHTYSINWHSISKLWRKLWRKNLQATFSCVFAFGDKIFPEICFKVLEEWTKRLNPMLKYSAWRWWRSFRHIQNQFWFWFKMFLIFSQFPSFSHLLC